MVLDTLAVGAGMRRLIVRYVLLVGAAVFLFLAFLRPAMAGQGQVFVGNIDGVISPPMANYVKRVIARGNEQNVNAIVFRMDTPGGLDTSMREIIRAILDSKVPVIVYVVPGGRAASAGTFIAMAAHVAAMSPGTAIGAASPVSLGDQQPDDTLKNKATNDAAEYIRSLAKLRGRNYDWPADNAVRRAESLDAENALKLRVIDLVSHDLPTLLSTLNGREISLNEQEKITLQLSNVTLVNVDLSLVDKFLLAISNPNIAFILLSLGMLGLFFELSNPGAIFPGVLGGIALLLAFYSLGTLQANWAGVLLMGLALALFIAEIFLPSHGILGAGAVVSFILGALMLWSGRPGVQLGVDLRLIGAVAGLMTLTMLFIIQAVVRSQRLQPVTGVAGLVGRPAIVKTPLEPEGTVLLESELWHARVVNGEAVEPGETVYVEKVDGLTVWVTKKGRR